MICEGMEIRGENGGVNGCTRAKKMRLANEEMKIIGGG